MELDINTTLNEENHGVEEISDSNSSNCLSAGSKQIKQGMITTTTPRFKGVVPQQNNRWGCQIYANHQRIWLGTFKSEEEAARAYDSAALKLRGPETATNFPPTDATADELSFQCFHGTDTVINMIKDGSYPSRFADYLRTRSALSSVETELLVDGLKNAQSNKGLTSKQLFQKELTPSDVGKLNRLVIPKKFAIKFFPPAPVETEENAAAKPLQLDFYDSSMKLWQFRYCYWRSSQSYVFTRGWNWFVKDKKLKANDTIAFSLCECKESPERTKTFYMIDVNPSEGSSCCSEESLGLSTPSDDAAAEAPPQQEDAQVDPIPAVAPPEEEPARVDPVPPVAPDDADIEKNDAETEKKDVETEHKRVILFGVHIN